MFDSLLHAASKPEQALTRKPGLLNLQLRSRDLSLVFVTRCPVEEENALEGACSHDDEPDKVRQFCCRWDLPYSRIFRSIVVYRAEEDPRCENPALTRHGQPFLLRPEEVLPDLQLVCSEDIQQAVLRGMDDPDGERLRVELFEDMSAPAADGHHRPPGGVAARAPAASSEPVCRGADVPGAAGTRRYQQAG